MPPWSGDTLGLADIREVTMEKDAIRPTVSVILNTYNRVGELADAIGSVVTQSFSDWQLVVVDDGSTDGTSAYVKSLGDPRIVVVRHENMGLTASRNAGAAVASGEWLAFLDDDDTVADRWLATLTVAVRLDVGIVFCGHQRARPTGELLDTRSPQPLGAGFLDQVGSFLPATWMMRRDVFEHAGGYLDGLPFIHQFELLLRAVRSCAALGLTTASVADPLLRYTVRDEHERPMQWPQFALDGGRWVLARHAAAFRADPVVRANHEGVVGVAAARCGRMDLARKYLGRSVLSHWRNPTRWLRLAASANGWTARRAWGTGGPPAQQRAPLPRIHELPASRRRGEDHLFLPWGYRRNRQASADSDGTPYWEEPSLNNVLYQEQVYRRAAKLMRRRRWHSVLDVGTGSGVKLQRLVLPAAERVVGFDQGSGIDLARRRCPEIEWIDGDLMDAASWGQLVDQGFSLLVCADVIEHVEYPLVLLQHMVRVMGVDGHLLISTPDRARLEHSSPLGPPSNTRHVREWSADEFELLLESVGLVIIGRYRFLPRGYRATVLEFKRLVWRVLHRLAVPDRRSNMAFLCRVEPSSARAK
jgi:SAM-dependent methyltransferase